jgi:hypothetical protein
MNVATELESPQTKSAATGRMKALVYHGPGKQAWEETPRPAIQVATDAIVRITTSTIPPHLIETLRWLGILIRPGLRERRDLVLENLAVGLYANRRVPATPPCPFGLVRRRPACENTRREVI